MIYFVEGVSGIGKSYHSRYLYKQLSVVREVIYYKEEYKNPLDLLRQAVLDEVTYNQYMDQIKSICTPAEYDQIHQHIDKQTTFLGEQRVIPFMHIDCKSKEVKRILDSLYAYEIDDGKVNYDNYFEFIKTRFCTFLVNIDDSVDYIFEGALLQNPLFTILGFYDITDELILEFYYDIFKLLKTVDYEVHHIKTSNIPKMLRETIIKRNSTSEFSWEKGFDKWFSATLSFKEFKGESGIISFSKILDEKQQKILSSIPFNVKTVER